MPLQRSAGCYFQRQQQQVVQLTSIDIGIERGVEIDAELKNGLRPGSTTPIQAIDPSRHLIGLSSKEALMLFQLLQAALLHPPMREGVIGQPELNRFHRQLSGALGRALASGAQKNS